MNHKIVDIILFLLIIKWDTHCSNTVTERKARILWLYMYEYLCMLVHVFVCRHKSINLQVLVLDSPIVLNRVFVIMWKNFSVSVSHLLLEAYWNYRWSCYSIKLSLKSVDLNLPYTSRNSTQWVIFPNLVWHIYKARHNFILLTKWL